MKTVIITIIATIIVMIVVLSIIPAPDEGRYYDCTIAEFHPDYPLEVKQACRQLIIESKKNYI